MGNCLRVKRSTQESSSMGWGDYEEGDGDHYDSSLFATKKGVNEAEKQGLFDHDRENAGSSANSAHIHKEIKIKITKKQLEKLLGEVEAHDMPVDLILARLVNANRGDDVEDDLRNLQHQRSWRPRLQSIPEVD